MNFHKLTRLLAGFLFLMVLQQGPSSAQLVKERFERLVISENFDSAGTRWQTMAASDNLFLVQNGHYVLKRKSSDSPFAVIGNLQREFKDFRLLTSLKLARSYGDNASVGVLLMAQPGGRGGFVFEINKEDQYRIRQISDDVYLYITGDQKGGGWVRIPSEKNEKGFHLVEIASSGSKYDLFLNKRFVRSFSDPGYDPGSMGFIIGPGSQGMIDYLYVFEKSEEEITLPYSGTQDGNGSPDTELTETIIVLKGQVNKLEEENEALRKTISAMKSGDDEVQVTLKNYEKQVEYLNEEIDERDNIIDSLERANGKLLKYKEIVGDKENSDIVISLSKSLKTEQEDNDRLKKENAILRKKLGLPATGGLENNNDSFTLPGK